MATTFQPPCDVERSGGLPTDAELSSVSHVLMDVDEYGLHRLIQRVAEPYIEAYENNAQADWSYEDVGRLATYIDLIVGNCELLLEKARTLDKFRQLYGEAVWNEGRLDATPPCSKNGGPYEPSKEALERWGLAGAR